MSKSLLPSRRGNIHAQGAAPRGASTKVIDHTCGDEMCEHKGQYVVAARCSNCGWEGEVVLTKGHEKPMPSSGPTCPRCECKGEIRCGEYLRGSPPRGES